MSLSRNVLHTFIGFALCLSAPMAHAGLFDFLLSPEQKAQKDQQEAQVAQVKKLSKSCADKVQIAEGKDHDKYAFLIQEYRSVTGKDYDTQEYVKSGANMNLVGFDVCVAGIVLTGVTGGGALPTMAFCGAAVVGGAALNHEQDKQQNALNQGAEERGLPTDVQVRANEIAQHLREMSLNVVGWSGEGTYFDPDSGFAHDAEYIRNDGSQMEDFNTIYALLPSSITDDEPVSAVQVAQAAAQLATETNGCQTSLPTMGDLIKKVIENRK